MYRFGESINLNLEMKDWIASTKEDYIKKAITFSADIEKLSEIRNGLRKNLYHLQFLTQMGFLRILVKC